METGTAPTGRVGRDPVQLELNGGAYSSIGVQIGDSRIIGLLLDLNGDVTRRLVMPLPFPSTLSDLISKVSRTVDELLQDIPPLLGVGVAVAGMVSQSEGTVFAPNLHDSPVDLTGALSDRLEREVVVENGANAMLLAEQTKGVLRNRLNALGINVGLGVGGGILVDGRLYSGHNGGSGEIGHMVVQVDGPLCSCGSRGCLEAFSGGKAIARALRLDETGELGVDVIRAAIDRNPDGRYHLETAARILGIGLANAANAINPEIIVCGGSHLEVYRPAMETLLGAFRRHALPINRAVPIRDVSLPEPEALGAGILMLNRFFGAPASQTEADLAESSSR